jgi:hypothetical protein
MAVSSLRSGMRITTSGFASMHIYHEASGTPVVTILRPARTPKGTEVRTVIKHVTKRLKRHWRRTRIIWRGDSHYGRVEAMEWAENNDADYIFGLAGNAAYQGKRLFRSRSIMSPHRFNLMKMRPVHHAD